MGRVFLLGAVGMIACAGDDAAPAGDQTTEEGSSSSSSSSTAAATSMETDPGTTTTTTATGTTVAEEGSSSSAGSDSSSTGPVAEGSLDVLTYNVAGLPQGISSSDPERYIPQISPLLNAYPLVLVQEDFWYHTELTADVTLPHASEPHNDDPEANGIGDGLNRFSEFPFDPVIERVPWYACHGQLDCSSDCLASKGWSFSRMTVDEGVELDVYNLHMEAGGCPEDLEIRTNSAVDLAEAIAARSEGRALIVAGDFNLRATDPEDVEPLMLVMDGAGLIDACDAVGCDDQRIDHIMIRSGDRVALTVENWRVPEEFVDAEDGAALSDHLPVASVIAYGPS